jgi:uroporphyrin-III C-methyltransferase
MSSGSVTLIGAGPGRADYLTLAAIKTLAKAEVILYDALIGEDIRDFFPQHARTQYVGKRCGAHSFSQPEINQLLIQYARQGHQVARLKGGDPFIFGRGAEEVLALHQAGIAYEIVPGISAMNGVAAQAGLPLTSRAHSNEFRAIQGHSLPDDATSWRSLASYRGTLVIYMGLNKLSFIVSRLLTHGSSPWQPLLIVETALDGQLHQKRGTLASFHNQPYQRQTKGPGIIYIGTNVNLMPQDQRFHAAVHKAPQSITLQEPHHELSIARLP